MPANVGGKTRLASPPPGPGGPSQPRASRPRPAAVTVATGGRRRRSSRDSPGRGPCACPAHRRHRPRCVRRPVPEARGGRPELPGGSAEGLWRRGISTGPTAAAAPRCPTPPSCGTSSRGEAAAPPPPSPLPGGLREAIRVACRPNGRGEGAEGSCSPPVAGPCWAETSPSRGAGPGPPRPLVAAGPRCRVLRGWQTRAPPGLALPEGVPGGSGRWEVPETVGCYGEPVTGPRHPTQDLAALGPCGAGKRCGYIPVGGIRGGALRKA